MEIIVNNIGSAEQKRKRWLGAPLGDRLKYMDGLYLKHASVQRAFEWLEIELEMRKVKNCASGLLIIAPTGCGKSAFVKELERVYPGVSTPEKTQKPVVSFKIPATPTPKALGEALLKALGDPLYARGSAKDKLDRLKILLPALGTVIIAIDDFQDVPANRRERGVERVANWIRDLCDIEFPGVVVALGTEEAAIVRDAHEQLRRRMQSRLEFPVFERKDDKFRGLLKSIDDSLPLAERSGFDAPQIAVRFHRANGGVLDYLMKLINAALLFAVKRGNERIELSDLERAFQHMHEVPAAGGNPFASDYDGRELDKPGEAFHRPSKDESGTGKKTSSAKSTAEDQRGAKRAS